MIQIFLCGRSFQKEKHNWIQTKMDQIILDLPIVLINTKKQELIEESGILEWIQKRFDCLIHPLIFSPNEIMNFVQLWTQYIYTIKSKDLNSKAELLKEKNIIDLKEEENSIDLKEEENNSQRFIIQNYEQKDSPIQKKPFANQQSIEFVYSIPFIKGIDQINYLIPLDPIISLIESGLTSNEIIDLIENNFYSHFKIKVTNLNLIRVYFPEITIKNNGNLIFKCSNFAVSFLSHLFQII
ncbi:centromere protein l [Anaeramoeba ignava]|uniref:Centromere protein l n=1 Tax=Anaeramoeba ignava TaxID=1746090 RepID=A0A9Q0LYY3_ANAIG|nr:centromere protein l [Anaeramoeba ignava]